jgi:hypothetical protein
VTIIGLDLAGVETRPTGFCTLIGMKATTCLIYKDHDLLQKVKETAPRLWLLMLLYVCHLEEKQLKKKPIFT